MTTPTSQPPGCEMLADMAEQPDVLRSLRQRQPQIAEQLGALPSFDSIGFVARGTSLHAAIYGRYLLELATGQPAGIVPPSIHTRYAATTDRTGMLAIGLSQSGATPEIVDSVAAMRANGATALGIVNEPESPLASVCDTTVELGCGRERAVPATKSFTAQLAAIAIAASALANEEISDTVWDELIGGVTAQLADTSQIDAAVDVAAGGQHVVCLGRGLLYPIALEAALKIVETSRLPTAGYSSTEFLHGPVAQAGPNGVAVCFVEDNDLLADTQAVAQRLQEVNMPVIAIGPSPDLIAHADAHVTTEHADRQLAPILHIIRAQQVARGLALHHNHNPDHPAGLSKVTATD